MNTFHYFTVQDGGIGIARDANASLNTFSIIAVDLSSNSSAFTIRTGKSSVFIKRRCTRNLLRVCMMSIVDGISTVWNTGGITVISENLKHSGGAGGGVLSQYHCVYQQFFRYWPGIEPGPPR